MDRFDTLIRGGMVIDGTRMPRLRADVGIRDGRIAAIGRLAGAAAEQVIDADGLIVAPGFIDLHTHYDAQVFWDPYCTLSGWHGVTSVVIGNCGFGFAPVRPEDRERAMLSMTRGLRLGQSRRGAIQFFCGHAHKVRRELGDVFAPFAQGWNLDGENTEAIEQILAETPGLHFLFQIAVRGGDNADIDLAGARVANALDFLLLQNPQKLGLHRLGDFSNLVQEQRAAVGEFESAWFVADRAGE
jgi:hypothetical protein